MADLKDLHILPLAGLDAVMSARDKNGVMQPTPLWRKFERAIARLKPKSIGLDTLADVYAGDENVRGEVRQFVGMVRGLCLKNNCAAVLLGHPSLSGMNSGSGTSGSTAWENSVRSRLYLHRPLDEQGKVDKNADPDLRILETMKQNYGPGVGDERQMRWPDGRFVAIEKRVEAESEADRRAREFFLKQMAAYEKRGMRFGPSWGPSYAPKMFAEDKEGKAAGFSGKLGRKRLESAMRDLIDLGMFEIGEEKSSDSKMRKTLRRTAKDSEDLSEDVCRNSEGQ